MDASPIIDFYPPDFRTDLNGKQQEWEAVVLIPFIDEVNLKKHFQSHQQKNWIILEFVNNKYNSFFYSSY